MCREQATYRAAAIMASTGVTAMAIAAVYLRFTWHMRDNTEFPTLEAAATLLLTLGGVVRPYCTCRLHMAWHQHLHAPHSQKSLG
jgi:membrane associated rhomboid family serine protease